ncbi:MAG TPA: hypothetical protein VG104_10445 [Candidatus Dormibacteraeota bacterium]|jgi:hypothetical protein|nr:hypothetical protein [Candidatus Dormibacteraeota bacterium]
MHEASSLSQAPYSSQIRWLFQAALLVFTVTVAIGILNGFHFITLPRQVLLTHVHAGTLGWITLGVFATCLWLFGEDSPGTSPSRAVQALGLLAAIGIPVYVLAFLSGNLLARAIFGFPVLIAIIGILIWLIGRISRVRMTVPRLAVLAAIMTLVVGSTIGVLVQVELASKSAFLPDGAIGGHVTAQVVGYLVLIGMAIGEWRLKNTPGLTWPGIVQVGLLFLGGILITIGALLNVQALLGAFIPAELIAVIIYCVRLGPQLRRISWLKPGSDRHFGLVIPYLVINLLLLMWLITGVVTKVYARFELIPLWLVFAFDHTMFIGVMSNSLFGLIQQASHATKPFWPWAEQVVFWGMNGGMIGFVLTLATDQRGLEKLFTPIMGGSILVGIVTYSVRLQRVGRTAPLLAATPA